MKDTPDSIAEVKCTPHNITEEKYTPMDTQSHDPVISLLHDSDDDPELKIIAEPPKQKKYKAKGHKSYLNLGLFSGVEPEIVDQIPWLVQGNRIFTIKCSEDYWHDKQLDGCHWKFTKSSHKGLDGVTKFGTCQGYFICKNNKCTKYTTEQVQNTIDFQRDFKGHTCRSCGFYTHREFCGCVKVTEYDKENNILTVYHQGTHSCTPKPDIQQHVEKAKEANFDNAPLNNAL